MSDNPAGHAPQHLVRALAQITYRTGPDSTPEAARERWLAQLQTAADHIWQEAWQAGAEYGVSLGGGNAIHLDVDVDTNAGDLSGRLTRAINRRLDRARAAVAGGIPLPPDGSVRLCTADLAIVSMFDQARSTMGRRARGRHAALQAVTQRMAQAYGVDSTP